MDLRVLWTNTATEQLEAIFDFYKLTVNLSVARKMVKGIVKRSASLSKQPRRGQREELLAGRQKEYRYLLEGNFKIIYWVDVTSVNIAAVFDTRQNPEKIMTAE